VGRARAIDDEIQRAITEADGFDLVTMGRGEGPRCYCYVNNLLRRSLDTLARNYDALILDNEAGLEHLSRRTTNNMDYLVTVANPTLPSLRAAGRVLELSRQLPIRIEERVLVLTRAGGREMPEAVRSALGALEARRLPDLPQDDTVERANAEGTSVFDLPDQTPALVAVRSVVAALTSQPSRSSSSGEGTTITEP
jgi:CO dehydrogenase maturation factor